MRIGLYGGTFSPPHKAHVRAARKFCKAADLDLLYVMPAGIPPHKTTDVRRLAQYRLEMTRLAFSSVGTVSDYEINKEGRSYTVETLRHLKRKHSDDELFMLVGEDMFFRLDQWREHESIMKLCTVVAMRREQTPLSRMEQTADEYREKYGARVIIIDDEPLEVSSTLIREMDRRR